MHVLALVTDAFGGYGGIAQYNRDLLAAMAETGCVDTLDVLPRLAPEPCTPAVEGLTQYRPHHNRVAYSAAAALLAWKRKPDIIFNGHIYHTPLALALQRLTGASIITQLHGTEVWEPLSPIVRKGLEHSRLVLCVSKDTQARYLAQMKPGIGNSAVLHNTVDEDFRPGDRPASRARFSLGEEFVLLTVGRLDPRRGGYKGHELVMRELKQLVTPDGRPALYLIAGDGPDRGRLEALVQALDLADRVRFLGKVPAADLVNLYRAADLFVLPSTGEGFGIVFLEAMACGTPAIGLSVGGACDALADGELGDCVTEKEFSTALQSAVLRAPPAAESLHEAVIGRFGKGPFVNRLADLMHATFDL